MNSRPLPWLRPPARCTPKADEVHVWRARFDQPDHPLPLLESFLAADERDRVRRYYFDRDRRRALLSRGVLRTLLGHYLDEPPASLRFDYNSFGKPSLAAVVTPLQFNVSHSGEWLVIAVALGRTVGIDIERIRWDTRVMEIARRFFSANECAALETLSDAAAREAFFDCWARKEAFIKAKGQGLILSLDQFDVAFLPGEAPRLLATRPDAAEASRWQFQELIVADGYKAALAVEGSGWSVCCWDWVTPAV